MGKTSQPLKIVVWSRWINRPEIQALAAKGHNVVPFPGDNLDADIILHPVGHRWGDVYWDTTYLETALKQARRAKKEAKA